TATAAARIAAMTWAAVSLSVYPGENEKSVGASTASDAAMPSAKPPAIQRAGGLRACPASARSTTSASRHSRSQAGSVRSLVLVGNCLTDIVLPPHVDDRAVENDVGFLLGDLTGLHRLLDGGVRGQERGRRPCLELHFH